MGVNEVDIITQESLKRYFDILRKKGYYNYAGVNKILLLIAIRRLLNSDMSVFINECDKRTIERVLNNLYCSICPIPTPQYPAGTDVTVIGNNDTYD